MEVYQPLDFSSNAASAGGPMSIGMSPRSPHSPHSSHSSGGYSPGSPPAHGPTPASVLDLCVRRPSPMASPRSPGSPRSPLYHPYYVGSNNNNNNSKSVNHNDVKPQLLLNAKMELDAACRPSLPSPPAYPHADLPDAGMSVLQQRLLPRSATSAFAPTAAAMALSALSALPTMPAARRRRTSSGLPDSPLGSSDDRSSTAASPSPSPPSMDLLGSLAPHGLGPLGTLGQLAPHYPASAAATALPLGATSPTASGALPASAATAAATSRSGKPTRPFKAYPKDPLSLAAGVQAGVQVGGVALGTAEAALGRASNEAYAEFRRRMLAQVQAAIPSSANKARKGESQPNRPPSPGLGLGLGAEQQPADSPSAPHGEAASASVDSSNASSSSSPESAMTPSGDGKDGKDAAYWERRRKNNEAAKRSRDARRAKEDEIAIRAAFLEQENLKLMYEVAALRNETAKLRCLLYQGATEC